MKEKDRNFLLERDQPFGVVLESKAHPGSPCETGFEYKSLGPDTAVSNHGRDHPASLADKGAGAKAYASRENNNPFAPTGKPS